jgi:hypothetical protein
LGSTPSLHNGNTKSVYSHLIILDFLSGLCSCNHILSPCGQVNSRCRPGLVRMLPTSSNSPARAISISPQTDFRQVLIPTTKHLEPDKFTAERWLHPNPPEAIILLRLIPTTRADSPRLRQSTRSLRCRFLLHPRSPFLNHYPLHTSNQKVICWLPQSRHMHPY